MVLNLSAYFSLRCCSSFRNVMRKLPQPVTVITSSSGKFQPLVKRGMTCSSFTSVSHDPPIISFSLHLESFMYKLLRSSGSFGVNLLSTDQVPYANHFAMSGFEHEDPFLNVPHSIDDNSVPVIEDVAGFLSCSFLTEHAIGDHIVIYGKVDYSTVNDNSLPLLYFSRQFRSVGDEVFIRAFEELSLPFNQWTHEAHLRMAWSYISMHGYDLALEMIRSGIQRYNERNKHLIGRGYHETITVFYSKIMHHTIATNPSCDSFEEFKISHPFIVDKQLPYLYYSKEQLAHSDAHTTWMPPDLKPLPS